MLPPRGTAALYHENNKPTGLETHKAYYCPSCGYCTPAYREGWATVSGCPDCRGQLSFVRFALDEKSEADRIVGRELVLA